MYMSIALASWPSFWADAWLLRSTELKLNCATVFSVSPQGICCPSLQLAVPFS